MVKFTLWVWHTCWYILGTTGTWYWNIMPRYRMHFCLNYLDRTEFKPITNWWCYLIQAVRNVQILERVKEHILCFIKVGQLIIAKMFHVHFINIVLRVNTMHHELQEWLYHISAFWIIVFKTKINMWFHNKHLLLYCKADRISMWLIMLRTPNTPYPFPE